MTRPYPVTRVLALPALLVAAATGLLSCNPAVPGLVQETVTLDGQTRTYRLYRPAQLPEGPLPTVVALHRFPETGAAMAAMTGFNAVAEREGFLAVYPDGEFFGWNDGSFDTDPRDDLAFFEALLDALTAQHGADPTRIYVIGASSGGFMAHRLACAMPERFAAAGVVMALLPHPVADRCDPATHPGIPMFLVHGTDDGIVPYDADRIETFPGAGIDTLPFPETAAFWAGVNGCGEEPRVALVPDRDPDDGTTTRTRTWDGCATGAEVVAYTVEGGGHTWPGGARLQPALVTGAQSRDFSASEAFWAFCSRYRR